MPAYPITGSHAEIMINASWGLGESIVGGMVTPDTFIVRKSDWAVTSQTIAGKQRMTVSTPGGTHEVDVTRFLRQAARLNEQQVVEIVKVAQMLETSMGHPAECRCPCCSAARSQR